MEKRIRYEHHVSSLIVYRKSGIAPKGLIINLKPATSDLSPTHEANWRSILHKASMDLLSIVIEHDQCCLDALKKEEISLLKKNSFHYARKDRTRNV